MSDDAPAMRVMGVRKTFHGRSGATLALDDVSLEVPRGSVIGLVGPNGSGKSTLMLVALGLVRPDRGHCELFGRPASTRRAREGIGFLAEEVTYEAGFRVAEILRLHRRLARAGEARSIDLDLSGIEPRLPGKRRISRCSLGTVRRLALVCALTGRPRLLLLDEPTSGLDVTARGRLLDELVDFARRGGSVLVSSHVLSELEAVCDAIIILERGRVVFAGDASSTAALLSTRLTIEGLSSTRLRRLLGKNWTIRELGDRVVAEGGPVPHGVGKLAHAVEREGGRVHSLARGASLLELFRDRVGS